MKDGKTNMIVGDGVCSKGTLLLPKEHPLGSTLVSILFNRVRRFV
jgi:hypothetical protein